jgi:NAD(P)-dependent dehydrogenase (short-subunit alcohol dehydrogenase family)
MAYFPGKERCVAQKVILISGATSGIGRACLERLHAGGYQVVGVGRSAEKAAALAGAFAGAEVRALDVGDTGSVQALVAETLAAHGRIDGLVNAAGTLLMERTHKTSATDAAQQVEVLFQGVFNFCQAVLPAMIKQKDGLIINLGSVVGARPAPGMSVYGAMKAAVQHFTTSLAAEYAGKGVRAVCVSCGPVQTGLMDPLMFEVLARKVPLGRIGTPEEVAGLVAYLLSDEARFMTGNTITMDGGMSLL